LHTLKGNFNFNGTRQWNEKLALMYVMISMQKCQSTCKFKLIEYIPSMLFYILIYDYFAYICNNVILCINVIKNICTLILPHVSRDFCYKQTKFTKKNKEINKRQKKKIIIIIIKITIKLVYVLIFSGQ
jgi:hypothetical protein